MSLNSKTSSDAKRSLSEVLYSRTDLEVQPKRVRNDSYLMQRPSEQRESSDAASDMGPATDGQLRRIASEAIGESWELIAPFLHVGSHTIAQIKENTASVTSKIFKMLKEWSQQEGSGATLKKLKSTLEDAPYSVTINWNVLNDLTNQSSSEISSSELTSSSLQTMENPSDEEQDNIDGLEEPKCFEGQNEDKGRLKKLTDKEIQCLLHFCPTKVGSGGFGQVYKSKGKLRGLDIDVVLKKIEDDKGCKMESITNEKLASRTMHFAIVPLLAYGAYDTNQGSDDTNQGSDDTNLGSGRSFFFLTPYLENGNLAKAIQNDNVSESPVLTVALRMKIMYHIASAIDFLHTPVPKFRGAILHMDIKSLNVVLDQWYNARLIDFGLAREMEEGCDSAETSKVGIPYSKGYCKTIRGGHFDVCADYHNFGVVIRELLTGHEAYNGKDELRELNKRELKKILMPCWKDSKGKCFQGAKNLLNLSVQLCSRKGDINSKEILNTVQKLMNDKLHSPWECDGKKCDMCMRYDAVDDTILEHNTNCKMRVCVSCMRHSYCNPIVCHSCGEVIIPNIGNGWDAVLIAGNDVDKPLLAKVFSDDVEAVKKVITSKCPLVMGISENRVLTIKPKSPGSSELMMPSLTDRLGKFLSDVPVGKQNTLVLYFSGHYFQNLGFQLGNEDEFISIEKLQNHLLGTGKTAGRCVRLIIFLDCCCAPEVKVDTFRDNQDDVILVQLNACRRDSKSVADETDSVFQRLFTQALTRRALSSECMNKSEDCGIDNDDFVTLYNLQEYITNHYKDFDSELSEPTVNVHNAQLRDIRIGYVVNFCVDVEFYFELKTGEDVKKEFPHSMYSNIEELRTILFDEYSKMISTGEGPPFSTTFLHEILFVFSKHGPKDKHRHELDTIEKVVMAWDCRRELHVSLRGASKKTGTHSVGVFFEKPVVDYLFENGTKTVLDENTVEYTTNFKNFRSFLKSQPTLEKVLKVVDGLHDAKDELKQEQKIVTNISVKFPYNENISPKYRTDFLCFRLLVDTQGQG